MPLLNGRLPSEDGHRNTVGAVQVTFHLEQEILVGEKLEVIIKAFLVISVAALHLTIMPGRLGTDCLVDNVKPAAKNIQRMHAISLLGMGKFSAVVRLDYVRCIAKVNNRTLHKVYGAVAAVFPICV